jgi:cell division protein FtsQ
MATQMRKKKVSKRATPAAKRRRPVPTRRPASKRPSRFGTIALPFFLSFCILVCLGALGFIGYRTVTASDFFDVVKIDVRGTGRSSKEDIERIVSMQSEKSGVWNADLPDIKARIEKLPFVKAAAVSRVLPNGIRVRVDERLPRAAVRLNNGDFLVDESGAMLARMRSGETSLPFVMLGWDEAKTEKAGQDNLERVKTYQKMLNEWQQFDLASRIKFVDLSDLREPRAVTEDSGMAISIELGRDNFGEHLKRGINAIVGKGETFEAVNLVGQNMILEPRKGK